MTTRADRYRLHYRTTKIERTLGIVNKWTSLPEGADIYTAPPSPDASAGPMVTLDEIEAAMDRVLERRGFARAAERSGK